MINIKFIASEVGYTEAIGGEIVQLSFDEDPNQDPFHRTKCYLLVSQNYEFPDKPTVEWHDGKSDDGGAEVSNYKFSKNIFELTTTSSSGVAALSRIKNLPLLCLYTSNWLCPII